MPISHIYRYFDELSPIQRKQFLSLKNCYQKWNNRVNVISRRDIDNLYTHHVLHSLGIAKVLPFRDGARLLDIGTGGGFPGIPLAILFPKVCFTLVDSIGKKITVVDAIARHIGLTNIIAKQVRAEHCKGEYDFAVSRAVAPMKVLYNWVADKIGYPSTHAISNGILCLKGGDLKEESEELNRPHCIYPLSNYFEEDFFSAKKVIHIPV